MLETPSIDVAVRYVAEGRCPVDGCAFVAERVSHRHPTTAEQSVLDVLDEHVRTGHQREAVRPRAWCAECGRYDENHHPECTQWEPGKYPSLSLALVADPAELAERGKELLGHG